MSRRRAARLKNWSSVSPTARWRRWRSSCSISCRDDKLESSSMGSVNKVILVGNLGRDAELRYTPGGAAVATLNMATTEVWNDKSGQRQEKTEWHRVVLWGKTAESLSEYLTKGKQIYVEGRLQTRQWDDKDGNKRYTTEIRSDRVVLLSGGGGGRGAGAGAPMERGESGGAHQQQSPEPS